MVRPGKSFAGADDVAGAAAAAVALMVDGDNVSPANAAAFVARARVEDDIRVARVYGRAGPRKGWALPGLRRVLDDAAPGHTDMLLAMDAVELCLSQGLRRFVIASSDGDFAQLALFLRERGCRVVGIGAAKAPDSLRVACHAFTELPDAESTRTAAPAPPAVPATAVVPARPVGPPQPRLDAFDRLVTEALAANGRALRLTALNAVHHKAGHPPIASTPHKTWRAYLSSRPDLFALDHRGPDASVRLR